MMMTMTPMAMTLTKNEEIGKGPSFSPPIWLKQKK